MTALRNRALAVCGWAMRTYAVGPRVPGILLVALIALDVGLTVLHPTVTGPLSHRVNRVVWRLVRRLALLTSRRLLVFAGTVATVTLLLTWLGGLWLGFGLVYLPQVSHCSTSVHSLHPNLVAALYASATTITTLGLSDTLPTQTGIRIAFALEAAAGVASVGAIVSYILSVYPLATQNRAHALVLSDLELTAPPAAFEYLDATGDGVSAIHERLVDGHQSLRRFPVLYYFHPEHERESAVRLLSTATVLCALACWVPPESLTAYGRRAARGLEATLERIREDYERRYIGGGSRQARTGRATDEEGRRSLTVLAGEAARCGVRASPELDDAGGFARFVSEMDDLLAGLSRSHLLRHQPLLERLGSGARPGG